MFSHFSFWFKFCIILHMVAIVGNIATGNVIGLVKNVGWIIFLYLFIKHDEAEKGMMNDVYAL